MDSKTLAARAARFATLSLIVALGACEDDVTVPPPDLPPQIATTLTYARGSKGLPNSDVYSILAVSNGELWIGTEQGIARYPSLTANQHSGASDIVNELSGLPNPKVRDMVEYDGKVYVATWGGGFGIYDIASDAWSSKNVADGLRHPYVSDIEVSVDESRLYFATNDGVSIYDPVGDSFQSFSDLSRPVVSSVAVRNSTAGFERWYGPRVETIEDESLGQLPEAGITVSRGTAVIEFNTLNSGLPEPNVNAITFDADDPEAAQGIFWVATSTKGVSRVSVDNSSWTTFTTTSGLPSNTVYSVARAAAPGGGSTIWVATQNGVARLQNNGTWQGYNTGGGLSADRVRVVYSPDGAALWIGYVNGGAARLNAAGAE
ncbi:MAG TPA: two-component regulator propeller domain-containing protein [Candidatus Krumholzibacteria bacterium]|nr:two-component regulator propeller domain-containing protein [Candidatus Krumholzibacteria bacterium]